MSSPISMDTAFDDTRALWMSNVARWIVMLSRWMMWLYWRMPMRRRPKTAVRVDASAAVNGLDGTAKRWMLSNTERNGICKYGAMRTKASNLDERVAPPNVVVIATLFSASSSIDRSKQIQKRFHK